MLAGLDAHVARVGRGPHRLVGQALEEGLLGVGDGRFAQGLRERADLGDDRDGEQATADLLDRVAALLASGNRAGVFAPGRRSG